MSTKRIAIICLGGSISSYTDAESSACFSFSDTKEIKKFLPNFSDISLCVYCNIIEKKFFLNINDWNTLNHFIQSKVDKFDGFVILQETDSILMGSAILSFLTTNIAKPIIFTSSPAPFGTKGGGNLAEKNVGESILFAASDLGEVAIYSHEKLIRAVRSKRRNISDPSPFFSGQMDDLGSWKNSEPFLRIHRLRRNTAKKQYDLHPPKKSVIFLRLYPGYPPKCLDHLFSEHKIDALVIESLGYGSLRPDIIEKLESFYHAGIPVVVIAEHDALHRNFILDADQYRNKGKHTFLLVPNMTIWATVAKANICAENTSTPQEFYTMMQENISGEIIEG